MAAFRGIGFGRYLFQKAGCLGAFGVAAANNASAVRV
jgi:hypothetical protein